MLVTVFTPTYNRAYILPQLYESLCRQTCKDFEWLVVDDGSSDNTSELVDAWMAEGKIDIVYEKVPNGGKHRAINRGVRRARGELFFIVDSDDHITDDAIEWLHNENRDIWDNEEFCGVCGTKVFSDGTRIGNVSTFPVIECTATEFVYTHNISGDMAEVFKTSVLAENPFPEISGERFCTEALICNRIADKGLKMRYCCKALMVCEYREDGLTAAAKKLQYANPVSTAMYFKELVFRRRIPLGIRFKAGVNYWRYGRGDFGRRAREIGFFPTLLYPLGIILRIKDRPAHK